MLLLLQTHLYRVINQDRSLKIEDALSYIWYHLFPIVVINREFKQIATAGATMAAVTEKVWGEYVAAVCQILAK